MELPRYRSQAIPQLASQSPEQAAAEAGSMGLALAKGLDVVAQVTARIQSAEAEAAASAALTDVELKTKAFLADPRWSQVELTDAKGTAVATNEVLSDEWKRFSADLLAQAPKIRDRNAKFKFEQGRKQLLAAAEVEVTGQVRSLMVERGKALTDYNAANRAQIGDFAGAMQAYEEGMASGLYSTAEYIDRAQQLQILQVEDEYLGQIRPGAQDVDLPQLATEILDDGRLPAANRRALFRSIVAETERRDRAESKAMTERQRGNAVALWENLDALTIADITGTDLRPEDKTALIKAKRAQNLEGVDDPTAIAEVNRLMVGLGDGSSTRDDVQAAITRNMEQGKLSAQGGAKLLTGLARTDDAFWQDGRFDRLLREGELAINKGVASEQLITMFAREEAQQRAALAVEWRQAFLTAKMDGGIGFNAEQWYRENLPKYLERSKAISAAPASGRYYGYGVFDKEQRLDRLATKKKLDEALAAGTLTKLQHQDAYREFQLDQ
jgi:hypothetical protein